MISGSLRQVFTVHVNSFPNNRLWSSEPLVAAPWCGAAVVALHPERPRMAKTSPFSRSEEGGYNGLRTVVNMPRSSLWGPLFWSYFTESQDPGEMVRGRAGNGSPIHLLGSQYNSLRPIAPRPTDHCKPTAPKENTAHQGIASRCSSNLLAWVRRFLRETLPDFIMVMWSEHHIHHDSSMEGTLITHRAPRRNLQPDPPSSAPLIAPPIDTSVLIDMSSPSGSILSRESENTKREVRTPTPLRPDSASLDVRRVICPKTRRPPRNIQLLSMFESTLPASTYTRTVRDPKFSSVDPGSFLSWSEVFVRVQHLRADLVSQEGSRR